MGVYLGSFLGLGFWSKLESADQPAAVSFASQTEAENFISTWETPVQGCKFLLAQADVKGMFCSIAACVAAGAEAWIPEGKPTPVKGVLK